MGGHWDRFWSGGGTGGGCLPAKENPIEGVQRRVWREFAHSLPKGAKVLDLATGDGRVIAWLIDCRRDLKVIGVDQAKELPPAPRGARLRGGVSIESMPFADCSFDAVTSQFGIEYARLDTACAEAVRTLRAGGRCRFLIHHLSGPIVRHNLARAEGLRWSSVESGAIGKARNFVAARAIVAIPIAPAFRDLLTEARAWFGAGSGAEEFMVALVQTVDGARVATPAEALAAIAELEQLAADELSRIAALTDAAADESTVGRIISLLEGAGAVVDPPRLVTESPGAAPFGWLLDGSRS